MVIVLVSNPCFTQLKQCSNIVGSPTQFSLMAHVLSPQQLYTCAFDGEYALAK